MIIIWYIYNTYILSYADDEQTKQKSNEKAPWITNNVYPNNQKIYDRLFFKQCWNWGEVRHISSYINALNRKKSWGGFCRHIREKTNIVRKLQFFFDLHCVHCSLWGDYAKLTIIMKLQSEKIHKQVSTFFWVIQFILNTCTL